MTVTTDPPEEDVRPLGLIRPGLTAEETTALAAPFPPEAIEDLTGRPGMTTIKAAWKFERLNKVLGVGGWTYEVAEPIVIQDPTSHDNIEVIIRLTFSVGGLVEGPGELVWRDRIPPITVYGSAKVSQEKKSGDDRLGEAYQGAITSGISRAIQMIGVGLQMRKGKGSGQGAPGGDRSGRRDEPRRDGGGRQRSERQGGQQSGRGPQNPDLLNAVLAARKDHRLSWDDLGDWLADNHNYQGRVVDAPEDILRALNTAIEAGQVTARS